MTLNDPKPRYERHVIIDTRTVQVFAQGVIVCVTVTACALVTVLCYLYVLKCLFIIIIIIFFKPSKNEGRKIYYYYTIIKSMRKSKNRRFHVPQPTFLFPLETPLRLSRNMLHGWKDNSMLAKPLAACTYLS